MVQRNGEVFTPNTKSTPKKWSGGDLQSEDGRVSTGIQPSQWKVNISEVERTSSEHQHHSDIYSNFCHRWRKCARVLWEVAGTGRTKEMFLLLWETGMQKLEKYQGLQDSMDWYPNWVRRANVGVVFIEWAPHCKHMAQTTQVQTANMNFTWWEI